MPASRSFDLAGRRRWHRRAGSGALAAAKRGKRVVVIDRDAQANGASVRNFGFITVTGQARGDMWGRARRTAEIWAEIAAEAGIPVLHRGLLLAARRRRSQWPLSRPFCARRWALTVASWTSMM